MYSKLECKLKEYGIVFKKDEPMKDHTSFKIGGSARLFITPSSSVQCSDAIKLCNEHKIPYHIIGRGTNLLVSDSGIDAAVICMSNLISDIKLVSDTEIYCQSGASLANVCAFALDNSLGGMEFAYGIPGNIGGAIAMNAGAYGGEMKDIVVECEYLDDNGEIHKITNEEMELSYRHSIFSDKMWCITSVTLKLSKSDKADIKEKMNDFIGRRKDKQPLDFPSAGSTFKRPEGSFASMLVDQCGLKGYAVGGAKVSEKHAGFVINFDNATCADVMNLMSDIQRIVYEKTGFKLEPEIKML